MKKQTVKAFDEYLEKKAETARSCPLKPVYETGFQGLQAVRRGQTPDSRRHYAVVECRDCLKFHLREKESPADGISKTEIALCLECGLKDASSGSMWCPSCEKNSAPYLRTGSEKKTEKIGNIRF